MWIDLHHGGTLHWAIKPEEYEGLITVILPAHNNVIARTELIEGEEKPLQCTVCLSWLKESPRGWITAIKEAIDVD